MGSQDLEGLTGGNDNHAEMPKPQARQKGQSERGEEGIGEPPATTTTRPTLQKVCGNV